MVASVIFVFNYLPKYSTLSLLEQIKETGELIVVTRNSPTTYYKINNNEPAGFEYELVKLFAEELGVTLTMVVPDSFDGVLHQIQNQTAHIAAAGLTITKDRQELFRFGPAYQEIEEQLIYNSTNRRPKNLSQLTAGTLEVVANSSHEERLNYLKNVIPDLSWKSNSTLESDELLQMVSDNIIEYTIADSNELSLNQRFLINLRVAFDISEPQLLAWALSNSDDNSLYLEVEKFFTKIKDNGELSRLIELTYGHVEDFDYVGTKIFMRHIETRLPKYRAFFERAAAEQGLDWRLIAAMGYQESHWNPGAVSPTGVRGIMMLTLDTAKDLKIKNRRDPESSIIGGARYFKQLLERININAPETDRRWMAMAAYNIGYGHLLDAKRIARTLHKDPYSWIDLKKIFPLIASEKWRPKLRYGYARGWEPVSYVENIRSYYDILKWIDDNNIITPPGPEDFLKIPNSI